MSKERKVFYNCKVYTGELPLRGAFAVENGFFTEVWDEIPSGLEPEVETVDLEGRFVCPGFNDSHMHLLNYGKTLAGADLTAHTGSLRDLKDHLRKFLEARDPDSGGWLLGRGWNQDYFSDTERMPDRNDLDEVSDSVPIMITRTCGHCCVLNTPALEAAGITCDTEDPEGGSVGRMNGVPDGRLYENAISLATAVAPVPDLSDIKKMIREAAAKANCYGITSVQTDDYGVFSGLDPLLVNRAYSELEGSGELNVRVLEQCSLPSVENLNDFIERGGIINNGDTQFRTGPLKLLADGSLGSRTARLSVNYPGTEEKGILIHSDDEIRELICLAASNGMNAVVHAIGDGALDQVLDAFEYARNRYPGDRRDGIVHCQVSRADQLRRISELGLCVYAQSVFLDYDNHIVEELVPEEIAATSYSWKTLLDSGVNVSNGSDCPVEYPDVMKGIQCAVTRTSLDGTGPYLPGQAFSVREALDSFTSGGAWAGYEENIKGKIGPGMLADFTVLGGDPFRTDPYKIKDIEICSTWLGGKKVF